MFKSEIDKIKQAIDPDVFQLFKESGVILAGGALTSLFTNREVNDYDLYFRTKEGFCNVLRDMYDLNKDSNTGISTLHVSHYTNRSILVDQYGVNLQFIGMTTYNSIWDIFDSFDFTINMCAFDFKTEELTMHKDFMKHNAQRFLQFNEKTTFPLVSALRVDKYRERGYTISKAQMFRILLACNQKKFESWKDFKNELGGLYGLNPDEVVDESKPFSIEEGMKQINKIFIPNKHFELKANPEFSELIKNFEHMIDAETKAWYDENIKDYNGFYINHDRKFDNSRFYLD